MADHILVGPEKLRAVATQLDHLRDQANATLSNYLNASHDIHGQSGWFGDAATANVMTTEEIHNAQMKLTTQWGELIHALRAAADSYEHQQETARASVSGVAQSM